MTLASRINLHFYLMLVVLAAGAGVAAALSASPSMVFALTLAIGLPLGGWLVGRATRPARRALRALDDGVRTFHDRDFSLRLGVETSDEVGELVRLYNEIADTLRDERIAMRQKEMMLESVLQSTPLALVLITAGDRIEYANRAARDLFGPGERLQGKDFGAILADCPAEMREVFQLEQDALFTVMQDGEEETYHLARRVFHLNLERHTLVMVRRLTHELRRQEVEIWKKVIRLMSHELNNSLAPITSLTHSARQIVSRPEHRHRLEEIFRTIEDRAGHLKEFLEGYARFARLPRPDRTRVAWGPFLGRLRQVIPFRLEGGQPDAEGYFDPSQLEQVLINLVKNAREAGSPDAEIAMSIECTPLSGTRIQVLDRGCGMEEEILNKALIPFYSSKQSGMGLGLPLCREIVEAHGGWLRIQNREGGGTAVTCWLPPQEAPGGPAGGR